MRTVERRLAVLEAHTTGADVVGIWRELHDWNAHEHNNGLVRVCGTDENLTQEAFAERYPNGTLVRVIYTNTWPPNGEASGESP